MNQYFILGGLVLALLLILPIKLFPEHPFVKAKKLLIQGLALLVLLIILGMHFYFKGMGVGIVAVVLGGLAIGKYIYDTGRQKNQ